MFKKIAFYFIASFVITILLDCISGVFSGLGYDIKYFYNGVIIALVYYRVFNRKVA